MTQRAQVKLFCAAVCVLVAVLCVFSRAPILAVAHIVAAVFAWRVGLARKVESVNVNAFINQLQDASDKGERRDTSVLATVWPNVIFAPMLPSQKRLLPLMSIVFRDEFSSSQWRALSTRLRHQPRAARRAHGIG